MALTSNPRQMRFSISGDDVTISATAAGGALAWVRWITRPTKKRLSDLETGVNELRLQQIKIYELLVTTAKK